jgi:hypothetical protein
MTDRELMQKVLSFLETNYLVMCSQFHMQKDMLADDLRKRLAQPDEWKSLSPFDKTLLRTTHAPLKPLYHDRVHDRSVCAEVVTDWDKFFTEIESKLREKNA